MDFEKQIFLAKATYNVSIIDPSTSTLSLDTNHLDVQSVDVNGSPATFSLSVPDAAKPHLGSRLEIQLDHQSIASSQATVCISYSTTSACSAAQWLPPAQTAGKLYPYVFTQCQAIHARSLLPCVDAPCVKMTYDAKVTVPSWATCVMSALSKESTTSTNTTSHTNVYEFHQPVPIPSYLFALAVGHLSSRDISPRCRVWSEPSMVEAVQYEFGQVEQFIVAAEELTMPYQWGRYDILCLPPSFPYGGMENPCLTFVTPTLLAGDRSLADVVAHEAAHSWSGNLVTNETWEHFWLNEGWTIFLQRKIMTKVHGDDKFFDFDAIGGWKHLQDDVELLPEKFTKLIPDLGDNDPDDAFSSVPYEKGFNLLYTLEKIVGEQAFAGFTKAYFDRFKFGVVTSDKFKTFFGSYFNNVAGVSEFDWDTWLYKSGMPETPDFDRTLSKECEGLSSAWIAVDGEKGDVPTTDISEWSTSLKICFLDAILATCSERKRALSLTTIGQMKEQYNMHESSNSEVLFRFCMLAVDAGDESILPVVISFITSQGRMKFVRPLYRALFKSTMGKDIAVSTFLANHTFYHPIAAKMVATDLNLNQDAKASGGGATKTRNTLVIGGLVIAVASVGVALLRGRRS